MMQHVQPENVGDAGGSERQALCIGHGIQPGTPKEIRSEYLGQRLLEETGASSYFDASAILSSEREKTSKKLVMIDAP